MTHDIAELNRYTGAFTAFCGLALFFCVSLLGTIEVRLRAIYDELVRQAREARRF